MRWLSGFVSSVFYLLLLMSAAVAEPLLQESVSQADQAAPGLVKRNAVALRLAHEHFDPLNSLPSATRGVSNLQAPGAGGTGYYIVQFDGPIEASWKRALEDIGVSIFDYIPDFAFIVKMDAARENEVRQLAHLRWLGLFQPSYKLSQAALDTVYSERTVYPVAALPVKLHASVFPGEDIHAVELMIRATGAGLLDTITTAWGTTLRIETSAEQIPALAYITGVRWIEPAPQWQLHNNVSTDVMNVRTPRDSHGLYGAGQTVGVADTGLDTANTATLHADFSNGAGGTRVTTIFDLVGDGAEDYAGHGTHVAGSVLGNGMMSGASPAANSFPPTAAAGMAPKANLVFQALADNATGALAGIPPNLNDLFSQAQAAGANLHTNSWGSNRQGAYTTQSEYVDQYMWAHKDFLILYSAGNSGVDLDADGVIDLYSVGAPATAKNCLTIGATEGYRLSAPGSTNLVPWGNPGSSWAKIYSAEPITSDLRSDNPDGLAAFSSRGPTLDGRYKPDMVAPGTNILSARSSLATGTGWGAYNADYMWDGGTSMSTPLTAGTAALLREYLGKVYGITPSAALLKTALMNSAADIWPGQYGYGAAQEIATTVPNSVEGWGRVNLGNAVYPAAPYKILYADNQTGLSTGGNATYYIRVADSNKPFKINLAWTDYPGSAAAQGGLVNDLDLTVTDPSSVVHYPDNAVQNAAVSTLTYDNSSSTTTYTTYNYAMRFTPPSYPAKVDSTTFQYYNPTGSMENVMIAVYAADGAGGNPGTLLFSTILAYVPTGWHTIGITGVTISSGDFYVYIESSTQGIYVDSPITPAATGRSYYWNFNTSAWAVSAARNPYIRANVRGTDLSTSYDRTNNAEGITLNNPATGTYVVNVHGYNVPYGPQPYALVASGDVAVRYQLVTSVTPPGSGSVTPNCSTGCWYDGGTPLSLTPAPSGSNTFSSWSGSISSLDAPLVFNLNGHKSITANFDPTPVPVGGIVRIAKTSPVYYASIGLAYAAAVSSDVIQMKAMTYAGALTFARTDIPGLSVTLKGGYNAPYSNNSGLTTVGFPFIVESGTITADKIIIQ